jgi:2-keto-4-pentenoate hydratase/2-oxohepta-3-ene-1,7-dioic acid hydratase in catechol pathway
MRFVAYRRNDGPGLAIRQGSDLRDLGSLDLAAVLREGDDGLRRMEALARRGRPLDESDLIYLPPITAPPKIVCVGLNYQDHVKEAKREPPLYPTFFGRFVQSLVAHGQPLVRPLVSEQFDYEGEIVAVIGKRGRHIARSEALDFVAGYSVFNDASVRDYQRKGDQWTLGKNFDGTGAFGPEFVTADELPRGAKALKIMTRLNGVTVQSATADEMIFDIPTLIARLSEAVTLEVGDLLVTGTPGGVGFSRNPKLFMKQGDVCEVEVEGVGILRNPVHDETTPVSRSGEVDSVVAR